MDLMELLPGYYINNVTMQESQGILSANINILSADLKKTIDECFVNTASALLSRYETIYGLHVDVSKSDVFRRERIRAKIRGTGTVTKQLIVDVASSYSNGEVEVIEHSDEYRFEVKFIGTLGIPPNMVDLTAAIEEIKPAHLAYAYIFTYLTWVNFDLYNKTWNEWDALDLTWDEFETYKEAV